MMRVGTAWDIAEACAYLGGPAAAFVTGEVLTVDGGGAALGRDLDDRQARIFQGLSANERRSAGSNG